MESRTLRRRLFAMMPTLRLSINPDRHSRMRLRGVDSTLCQQTARHGLGAGQQSSDMVGDELFAAM